MLILDVKNSCDESRVFWKWQASSKASFNNILGGEDRGEAAEKDENEEGDEGDEEAPAEGGEGGVYLILT